MRIKGLPNEERPREKLLYQGKEALSNAELLAILLRAGTREKSALEMAQEIMTLNDSGLLFLQECSPEELAAVKGIGTATAGQILAAVELGKRIAVYPRKERPEIGNPEDIAQLFMERLRYMK